MTIEAVCRNTRIPGENNQQNKLCTVFTGQQGISQPTDFSS